MRHFSLFAEGTSDETLQAFADGFIRFDARDRAPGDFTELRKLHLRPSMLQAPLLHDFVE